MFLINSVTNNCDQSYNYFIINYNVTLIKNELYKLCILFILGCIGALGKLDMLVEQ